MKKFLVNTETKKLIAREGLLFLGTVVLWVLGIWFLGDVISRFTLKLYKLGVEGNRYLWIDSLVLFNKIFLSTYAWVRLGLWFLKIRKEETLNKIKAFTSRESFTLLSFFNGIHLLNAAYTVTLNEPTCKIIGGERSYWYDNRFWFYFIFSYSVYLIIRFIIWAVRTLRGK